MTRRETWVAYLLIILGGYLGIHKFYMNRVGWGLAYLFTGGFCLIGVFIDLFTLPWQVEACNREMGWSPWRYAPPPCLPPDFEAERRAAVLSEADRKLQDFTRRLNNLESVIDAKRN
ncbi:MAG TPA: TM2 domain-containing protein [Chthoniobacteraceae bacterium]